LHSQRQEVRPEHARSAASKPYSNPNSNQACAVSADDQVKAYIKKIMSQLDRWMVHGKISKLVIVITNKDTGEHVERWEFNVDILARPNAKRRRDDGRGTDQENIAPG
jgi:mitotic spindle assembly checkpoint protein MAD2